MNALPDLYPYVLESLDIGIWAVDKEGNFVYFNKAMEEMTGVSRENVLGQNLFSVFGRLDNICPEFKRKFFEAQKSLKPGHYENMQFVKPDGSTGYQYGSFCPMKNENGKLLGMITVVGDMPGKVLPKGREAGGEEAPEKKGLEEVMTSDLLNPLSVILAYTEVMIEEETSEDKILDLQTIRDSAEKMSNLLKDLTWEDVLGKMDKEKREKD